jgi:hypothetical protein
VVNTSSDSPQAVTLQNEGNAPLVLATAAETGPGVNPIVSDNFTLVNSSTSPCPQIGGSSSSGTTLAENAECSESIGFTPVEAGTIAGSVTITGTGTTLSVISLNSTATAATGTIAQTITFPQPLANSSVTLMATASSGLPVYYTLISGPAVLLGSTLT